LTLGVKRLIFSGAGKAPGDLAARGAQKHIEYYNVLQGFFSVASLLLAEGNILDPSYTICQYCSQQLQRPAVTQTPRPCYVTHDTANIIITTTIIRK